MNALSITLLRLPCYEEREARHQTDTPVITRVSEPQHSTKQGEVRVRHGKN